MVRLRYVPNEFELTLQEWAIDILRKKLKPEFVDFSIRRLKENDKTFIDFYNISIFDDRKVYEILKQK